MNKKNSQTQHRLICMLIFFLGIYIMIFAHFGIKKLDIIIDNQETIISIQAENNRQSFLLRAEIDELKDFWQGDAVTKKEKKIDLKDKSWKRGKNE